MKWLGLLAGAVTAATVITATAVIWTAEAFVDYWGVE